MATDGEKRGPLFFAYGPYDLPRAGDGSFDYAAFKRAAQEQDGWTNEPGCYVICRAAKGKLTALYIGKSEGPLLDRLKQHRSMIDVVMSELGAKTRLQVIMLHYFKGRGKLNSSAIESLETELIQIAMGNGLKLNNIQKTRRTKVCIAGVQNGQRGQRSPAAMPLKAALGIRSR